MALVMRVDDEIRLKILDALLKKRSVIPNIRQIQKYTGFHKATIKSSLDYLQREGLLQGFGPKLDFKKLGYKLEVRAFFQLDMSDKKIFDELLKAMADDPNLYWATAVIGSGNWNMMVSHIYRDVESYHKGIMEKYYQKIPGIYKAIKDRQIFYVTDPSYKNESRTDSVIEIIKTEKGFQF
ncbi:MAG TPA: hypothetical protein HA252_02965 [Candidatus Diapherotrites archaeon]|uniref:Lrp/AsnC family transcriptional regulator n=1 Tax=Candidatus Iainarchaeum sp. TaxID=3101447 RepID=A0A7J4JGS4_9ARCH|nr:hypothetical protein [Candidatus Diapherotrites archaeon]